MEGSAMPGGTPGVALSGGKASEPLGSQLLLPSNLKNNYDVLNYNKILSALLAGCFTGISGVTGYKGFVVYLIAQLAMGALLLLKTGFHPGRFFPSASTPLLTGVLSQTELLTFILFWTLAHNVIHLF